MTQIKIRLTREKERLKEAYDRWPEWILGITEPMIGWAKVIFLFLCEIRVDVLLLHGEWEKGTRHSVLYIGAGKNLDRVKQFLGHQNSRIIDRHHRYIWQLGGFLKRRHQAADCILLCVNTLLYRVLRPNDYFRLLPSVKSFVDTSDSAASAWHGIHPSAKQKIKKAGKKNLTYEIIPGGRAWHTFYYGMYLPYIRNRFGERAIVDSPYKVRRLLRNGLLLLVKEDDRWLAGAVCRIRNGELVFELVGVWQGDMQHVAEGAQDALYLHFPRLARAENCHGVDLGLSPPFLKNGLLLYKNKWGAVLRENPKECLEIGARISHPEKLGFLAEFPIVKIPSGLAGLTCSPAAGGEVFGGRKTIEKTFAKSGLRSLLFLTPAGTMEERPLQ